MQQLVCDLDWIHLAVNVGWTRAGHGEPGRQDIDEQGGKGQSHDVSVRHDVREALVLRRMRHAAPRTAPQCDNLLTSKERLLIANCSINVTSGVTQRACSKKRAPCGTR